MTAFTPLYTSSQIKKIEQRAINNCNISETIMMDRAGQSILTHLQTHFPHAKNIMVFCGGGNNGGDGYVLARLAQAAGLNVQVLAMTSLQQLTGAALQAAQSCVEAKVPIKPFTVDCDLTDFDLIVDALLGIGLKGNVRAEYQQAILVLNRVNCPIIAVDTPSGLEVDTGAILGCAVAATLTITFIGYKQGLLTNQGPAVCGKIILEDLQLPTEAFAEVEISALRLLPEQHFFSERRKRDAHKGHYGHVLIIGGDYGMAGAVQLAGYAALRAGAGLVSVATRHEHVALVSGTVPELMTHGVRYGSELIPLLTKATVVVIGPGLGQQAWGEELFEQTINQEKPIVVDADALNLLSRSSPSRKDNWVLTPHPGEAARLLNILTYEVQADRFQAISKLQSMFGGTIVLKGPGSLIKSAGTLPMLCSGGNPGMASGGMGDVLTGIIGAFIAQGLSLFAAAQLAVLAHAKAGDLAATLGERGMLASDLLQCLREVINQKV